MNTKLPTGWDEQALHDRLRQAFVISAPEAPSGIARRALELARSRRHGTAHRADRSSTSRLALASTLVVGTAVALVMLRLPHDIRQASSRTEAGAESGPGANLPLNDSARDSMPAPGTASDAKVAMDPTTPLRGVTRRPKASTPTQNADEPLRARRLAYWQQQQAADLDAAARLLEQAGQMEPAYQLYSMSIEAAPTLDATLGAVRVLKKLDEATTLASPHQPENSG